MKKCKICEKQVKKRNVCKECKEKFPYTPVSEGGEPFNRKVLFEKETI